MCSPSPLLWGCVRPDNDSYSARLVEQSWKSKTVMEQEEWDRLFFSRRQKHSKATRIKPAGLWMSCSGRSRSVIWLHSDLTIFNNFMIHGVLRVLCLRWSGDHIPQQQSDQRLLDFQVHLHCADTFQGWFHWKAVKIRPMSDASTLAWNELLLWSFYQASERSV